MSQQSHQNMNSKSLHFWSDIWYRKFILDGYELINIPYEEINDFNYQEYNYDKYIDYVDKKVFNTIRDELYKIMDTERSYKYTYFKINVSGEDHIVKGKGILTTYFKYKQMDELDIHKFLFRIYIIYIYSGYDWCMLYRIYFGKGNNSKHIKKVFHKYIIEKRGFIPYKFKLITP